MAHILLLEDEYAHAQQYKAALETNGHTVALFSDFDGALDYFEKEAVDLIVSDLFIKQGSTRPPKGGISLIAKIKQIDRSDVPIIAISGAFKDRGEHQTRLHAVTSAKTVGADATLSKPFSSEQLLSLTDNLLNRKGTT